MEYTLDVFYVGHGDTLRSAIIDALNQRAQGWTLPEAQAWGRALVQREYVARKKAIFAQAEGYDPAELIIMLMEARDYKVTNNLTASRYPLANGLAQARGVTLQTVLNAWGNSMLSVITQLVTLVRQQEQATDAINAAANLPALRDVMAAILEAIA